MKPFFQIFLIKKTVLKLLFLIALLLLISCDQTSNRKIQNSRSSDIHKIQFTDNSGNKDNLLEMKGIEAFLDSLEYMFTRKIDTSPNLVAAYYTHFGRLYEELGDFFPQKAYLKTRDGSYNRVYINDHKPTEGHDYQVGMIKGPYPCAYAVVDRIKKMESEGMDIAPYQLDQFHKDVQELFGLYGELYDLAKIKLTEEEIANLKIDVKKEKKRKKAKFTAEDIFEFCFLPQNADRYPTLHDTWKAAYKLASKRAKMDAQFEINVAQRYYMMMRALLVDERIVEKYVGKHFHNTIVIDDLDVKVPHYAELVKGYVTYLKYEEKVYSDYDFRRYVHQNLIEGAESKIVQKIKNRLAQEGYWNGDSTPNWGKSLTFALVHYQQNHHLQQTEKFDLDTAKSFETTISERLEHIRVTLKILRGSKFRWEDFYVRADTCARLLEVCKGQKVIAVFHIFSNVGDQNKQKDLLPNSITGIINNSQQKYGCCNLCSVQKHKSQKRADIFALGNPENTCFFGTEEDIAPSSIFSTRKALCLHVSDLKRFTSLLTNERAEKIAKKEDEVEMDVRFSTSIPFYISCLPAAINNRGEVVFNIQ